jgi:hypothetical protein
MVALWAGCQGWGFHLIIGFLPARLGASPLGWLPTALGFALGFFACAALGCLFACGGGLFLIWVLLPFAFCLLPFAFCLLPFLEFLLVY